MSQEQRTALEAALIALGQLGGNMAGSQYRNAWVELRDLLQPAP